MLQAILHNKFGKAISSGSFRGIEDTLTSSVIGLMQYLPDDLFWRILRGACGRSTSELPVEIGSIHAFHFWERFDATGTNNTVAVEPDVWIETEEYDIIVEAKRSDNSADNSQYEDQWSNQIVSLQNSYGENAPKALLYIALGGNDSLMDSCINLQGSKYIIHTASWYLLLNEVLDLLNNTNSRNVQRLLSDIVKALQVHRIIKTTWLDTLPYLRITTNSDLFLYEIWDFDNKNILSQLITEHISYETDLKSIWKIATSNY